MNFLEYLYCKYYYFQVRVGNADIAPFTSMIMIIFAIMLYYYSIPLFLALFVPNKSLDLQYFVYFFFILLTYLSIHLYFLLLYKGKYKKILKNNIKKSSNLGAIIFPLIGFLLFNLSWILKMLQNTGKI